MRPTKPKPFIYSPPNTPLDILYEDEDIVLLNKPSGLLSVPGKASDHKDCLESRVQAIIPNARIVHRLDMATSGVIAFAKTAHAHRHLGLQFEKRQTRKTYGAIVHGEFSAKSGRIDLPLICDWPNRPMQMVDFKTGKRAITDWEVIAQMTTSSRLKLYPITGRSHQLRVHMLAINHPIIGDRLYAPQSVFEAAPRLCLHASSLAFRHPIGGRNMEIHAPCPF